VDEGGGVGGVCGWGGLEGSLRGLGVEEKPNWAGRTASGLCLCQFMRFYCVWFLRYRVEKKLLIFCIHEPQCFALRNN